MEDSILVTVKKMLGLGEDYTVFDLDVITHINSVFTTLTQLAVGPPGGFSIEDDTALWGDFITPEMNLHAVKTYIYLRVRLLFDPPQTAHHQTAVQEQIKELEWRLNVQADPGIPPEVIEPIPAEERV
jgi:hypothetical protein